MKKIFTFSGFFFASIFIFSGLVAQEYNFAMEELLQHHRMNKVADQSRIHKYYLAKGTPYLNGINSMKGEIKIRGGGIYKGYLRYDMYANEVQYLAEGTYYSIGNPQVVEYIMIGDTTLIYALTDLKKGKGSYFELVLDGKCRLLAKKEVDLLPAIPAKAYADPKPAMFSRKKDRFFILSEGIVPQKINTKKQLFQALSNKEKEVEQYVKKSKPSLTSRKDVFKLIEYYNTL